MLLAAALLGFFGITLFPFVLTATQVSGLRFQVSSEGTVLAEPDWMARRAAHERRVRIWTDPQDDYTRTLLASFPRLTGERGVVLR